MLGIGTPEQIVRSTNLTGHEAGFGHKRLWLWQLCWACLRMQLLQRVSISPWNCQNQLCYSSRPCKGMHDAIWIAGAGNSNVTAGVLGLADKRYSAAAVTGRAHDVLNLLCTHAIWVS